MIFLFFFFPCSLFYQSLKHNPNGRFVVVCGDGEYIIYTALAWRNRSFGSALEFAWSSDGEYAVRETTTKIKLFSKNFQVCFSSSFDLEISSCKKNFTAEILQLLKMGASSVFVGHIRVVIIVICSIVLIQGEKKCIVLVVVIYYIFCYCLAHVCLTSNHSTLILY